ncbi:MAG TPA: hypothetical protein VK516_11485, partial [Gemmatimonadaceae bacterium]|nr:hypothetical protein [Gemmatimonadaceae bacterium]
MNVRSLIAIVGSCSLVLPCPGRAQDTAATQLAPVIVEVGRGGHRSPLDLPFAVTVQTPDS